MKTKLSLKETLVARVGIFTAFREVDGVGVDKVARTARVILITEGLGNLRDKNFYTKEAIASCAKVFQGKQFYVDHPSKTEEEDRPERSMRDLAGYFYDCTVGTIKDLDSGEPLQACFATLKFAESEPGQLAMTQVATALEYQRRMGNSKELYAGISINAGGMSEPGQIEGMDVNMVREIHDAFSADIVTKPARGGKFLSLMQEAARTAAWKRSRVRERRLSTQGGGGTSMAGVKKTTRTTEALGEEDEAAKKAAAAAEVEVEGEAEGEAEGDPMGRMMQTAEGFVGKLRRLRSRMGGGEAAGETEGEGEAALPPEIADDPQALLDDMKQDLAALGDHLGQLAGGGDEEVPPGDEELPPGDEELPPGDEEVPPGDEMAPDEGEGEGEGEAGRAMQYACASCGEENEVLPPKGFRLAQMGEAAARLPGAKSLREAYQRLLEKFQTKESRFAKTNGHLKRLVEENVTLKAENVLMRREKTAVKMLREAGVPGDILSVKNLLAMEPEQWAFAIQTARRTLKIETRLTETGPGPGGRPAGGGSGAKEAQAVFDARYKATS